MYFLFKKIKKRERKEKNGEVIVLNVRFCMNLQVARYKFRSNWLKFNNKSKKVCQIDRVDG